MDDKQAESEGHSQPAAKAASSPQSAQDVEGLQSELEEARREIGQFKDLLQRTQADFLNFKRRAEGERQELAKQASAGLILGLLPVLDDFERALDHIPAKGEEARWLKGVTLIYRNLRAVLEAHGLNKVQAQDQLFDPWEHEALFHEETPKVPEGQILRVIRDGYKLHGRVIRPAQVSIAKGGPAEPEIADGPSLGKKEEA